MKKKFNNIKSFIIKNFKKIRKTLVEYIITNRLFLSFVILSWIATILARGFTVGTFLSFKPMITDLGIILVIGSFGYLIKPKNQFKYYFTWLIIFNLLGLISTIYYMFFTSFPSIAELGTLGQTETVTGSIFDKLKLYHILFILIPVIFYLIHKRLTSNTYYYFVSKIEKGKKMLVSTLLVGALALSYSFGVATNTDYSRLYKLWYREYIVERFGIILYQLNDSFQYISSQLNSIYGHDSAEEEVTAYFEEKEKTESNEYTNILQGKNIIFVHMESMQTFLMDLEFNGEEVTPNLNKLASEGMFFTNFYAQVSTGTSSDTEFTLLTGLLPASSGVVFTSYYDRTYFTLPKYFKNLGYYTFSMHGNLSSMWNRYRVHPALGYEGMYFSESYTYTDDDVINLGINDKLFYSQSIPILETIESTYENYMGTIITLSNHSPFKEASQYSNLDLSYHYTYIDEDGNEVEATVDYLSDTAVGEYIKSANYADEALGEFIEYILESDAFDDTIFVFYGDHDAKLSKSEMNYLYNLDYETGNVYTEEDEEYTEYDSFDHELNKSVPLIIWTKDEELQSIFSGEVTYYTGMYNVAATILNMYGVYNKYTIGDDIFSVKDDNIIVFASGNVLTNKVYYNNSTGEYKLLTDEEVDEEYIEYLSEYAEEALEVSNNIIVYDLLSDIDMYEE